MYWTNYHSHCKYCDGNSNLEDYIHEAIRQKVKIYGFSSHAPLPFSCNWSLHYAKVSQYLAEASLLKQKFKDLIQIYTGMEVDFIPSVIGPASEYIKTLHLDYIIGSIHFVDRFEDDKPWQIDAGLVSFQTGLKKIFDNNIKKAVKKYYELTRVMLNHHCPEVLGHLDKIKMHNLKSEFFSEDEKWYRREVLKTLKVLAKSGSILEVNTRGGYLTKNIESIYPSPWILQEALTLNIPIMINSDTHKPIEITKGFEETLSLLLDIGFKEVSILIDKKWQKRPISKEGIDI